MTTTTASPQLNMDTLLAEVTAECTNQAPAALQPAIEMTTAVDQLVTRITNLDSDHSQEALNLKASIESFGLNIEKESGKRSEMLKQNISKLDPTKENDPNNVGNILGDLNTEMIELDPTGVSLDKPWWVNLWLIGPMFKTPLQKYFLKYQSADEVIDNIRNSLLNGQKQLQNDNIILENDQVRMKENSAILEKAISAGLYLQQQVNYAVDNEIKDPKIIDFVKDQILFPLNQRIIDLQQRLAVNGQGILSTAVIIRTNDTLIKGVNRALAVSMRAMEIAAMLSLALANQKLVLRQIGAVNQTTDKLIAGVATMLKTNTVEIQQQAGSANLNMDNLKEAMLETRDAIQEIVNFRVDAVSAMNDDIVKLNTILSENKQSIDSLDRGRQYEDAFQALTAV